MRDTRRVVAVTIATAILGMGGSALAQRDAGVSTGSQSTKSADLAGPGRGGGWGMGPGMMGGGWGMGPGMMGGGWGMGPGMMGSGWGTGPGMMGGGWGMGPGLGGYGLGGVGLLELSPAQRTKLNAISDELRKKQWALLGQVQDDEAKLRDLSAQPEPDPKAVGSVYVHMSKLRQQMIESHANAMDQARAVLTPEQRNQLDQLQLDAWGPRHPRRGGPPGRP